MHFLDDRSYHYRGNGRIVVQKVNYQDVGRVGVLWLHFRLTASAILSSTQCRLEEGEGEGGREDTGTTCQDLAVQKGLRIVLSFSVVSGVVR